MLMLDIGGKGKWKGVVENINAHLDPWIADGLVTLPADVEVCSGEKVLWRARIELNKKIKGTQPQVDLKPEDFPLTVTVTSKREWTIA